MSIKGQSFNPISTGARVDFGPGTVGLESLFATGYTIAVLAKTVNSNFGLFAGMSDAVGGSYQGAFFLTFNDGGGRLFGDGDFSSGFPGVADDANGLQDGVWRWHVMNKPPASFHYRFHYADLATLTWFHGESIGSANHADHATPVVVFTTGAIYPMGFDSGDIAAIVVWPASMSDAQVQASCTQLAADIQNRFDPKAGWFFSAETDKIRSSFTLGSSDNTNGDRNLGFQFQSDVAITSDGLWYFHSPNVNKPSTVQVQLYNSTGSSVLADSGSVDSSGFTSNVWTKVLFASPVNLSAATDYVANIYFAGALVYDPDDLVGPITSTDGHVTIPASGARFLNATGVPAFPTATFSGMFGLDLSYYLLAEDVMGSDATESHRQLVLSSPNPSDFDFAFEHTSSLFKDNERPSSGHDNFTDGSPGITTAVGFRVFADGEIRAIKFFATTGAAADSSATYTAGLWHVTSGDSSPAATLLGSTVSVPGVDIVPGEWNTIELPSPIPVTTGNVYRAGVHNDAGRYVANNNYYTSHFKFSDDGLLIADNDGDNPGGFGTLAQGTFILGPTIDYPRNTGSAANYWIDVVYGPATGGGGPAPYVAGQFMPFFMS